MGKEICPICGQEFEVKTTYTGQNHNYSRRFCSVKCRKKANRIYFLEWKRDHPGYFNHLGSKTRRKIILMYGPKCECCGEIQMAFLTIDHCGKGTHKDRLSPLLEYRRILREHPDDIHIVCMNCNYLLGRVFLTMKVRKRYCPIHHPEDYTKEEHLWVSSILY